MSVFKSNGGKIDGSDADFKSAARSALAEPITIISPADSATGIPRDPWVEAEEPVGAVWMHADLTADQTTVGSNTDIIFDQIHSQSNSGISLNASTGVFTLPAGHVFELEALIYAATFSLSTGNATYEWVYEDNSEIPGAVRAVLRSVTDTAQAAMQATAKVILRTQEDAKVKLRCISASGTHTMVDLGTNAHITEISTRNIAADIASVHFTATGGGATINSGDNPNSYNFLSYSHDPSNAAWAKTNATVTKDATNDFGYAIASTDGLNPAQFSQAPAGTGKAAADQHILSHVFELHSDSDRLFSAVFQGADAIPLQATVSYVAATDTATVSTTGTGWTNVVATVTKLATGRFRLQMTGLRAANTGTLAVIYTVPVLAAGEKYVHIASVLQDGSTLTGITYKTGADPVLSPRVTNLVIGDGLLPNLTDISFSVQGKDSTGAISTPAKSVTARTELRGVIELTGPSGNGDIVQILIGESSGVNPALMDFHVNGNLSSFPSGAGQGGALQFKNWSTGAALSFEVVSVTGIAPNRIASVMVAVDAQTRIVVQGGAGSNLSAANSMVWEFHQMPNIQGFWDFSKLTVANGAAVTSVANLGASANGTLGVETGSPVINTPAAHGVKGVLFDGVNDAMITSDIVEFSDYYTMIAAVTPLALPTAGVMTADIQSGPTTVEAYLGFLQVPSPHNATSRFHGGHYSANTWYALSTTSGTDAEVVGEGSVGAIRYRDDTATRVLNTLRHGENSVASGAAPAGRDSKVAFGRRWDPLGTTYGNFVIHAAYVDNAFFGDSVLDDVMGKAAIMLGQAAQLDVAHKWKTAKKKRLVANAFVSLS